MSENTIIDGMRGGKLLLTLNAILLGECRREDTARILDFGKF